MSKNNGKGRGPVSSWPKAARDGRTRQLDPQQPEYHGSRGHPAPEAAAAAVREANGAGTGEKKG